MAHPVRNHQRQSRHMTPAQRASFIRKHTLVDRPALLPEISLHLASSLLPLWQESEAIWEEVGAPPPFWAFAWAGGQALARWILDNPGQVAGRSLLDFGAGSGVVAIAAAKAGAAPVVAVDIDPMAAAAMALNAALNKVELEIVTQDLIGRTDGAWEIVAAGDICYEQPMSDRALTWLQALAAKGVTVLLGDPQRTYLPKYGLEKLAGYSVKTPREIEDSDLRNAAVWRMLLPAVSRDT